MKYHSSVAKVFNLVALLAVLFNLIQPALVAQAMPAARPIPQAVAPTAPSELAQQWPQPTTPQTDRPSPFLDPTSLALEQALGGVIEADLVGGAPTRLERLTSPIAPLAALPGDSLPTAPDPLAQTRPAVPQAGPESPLAVTAPQPADPLSQLSPALPAPSDVQSLAEAAKTRGEEEARGGDEAESRGDGDSSGRPVVAKTEGDEGADSLVLTVATPAIVVESPSTGLNESASPQLLAGTEATAVLLTGSNPISITTAGFSPPTLTTTVNMTVTWFNSTDQPQRLRGGSPIFYLYLPLILKTDLITGENNQVSGVPPDDDPSPETWSDDILPDDVFSRVFTQTGVYSYYLADSPVLTGVIVVQPQPTFLLAFNPSTQAITQGQAITYSYVFIGANDLTEPVELKLAEAPDGISNLFEPNPLTATTSGMLTVTTALTTPVGTYSLTLIATGGEFSRTEIVWLNVVTTPVPAPSLFELTISPTRQFITQGQTITYTYNITALNSFTGPVGLALDDTPNGISGLFEPNPVTATTSGILTVTTTLSTPIGTQPLTITAESGEISQTTTLSLTVLSAWPVVSEDTVFITPAGGVLNSTDGHLSLEVPPGAVASPVTITYHLLPTETVTGFVSVGPFFELTAVDTTDNKVTQFNQDLTLKVSYGDNPDPSGLFYHNELEGNWQPISSTVDINANVVTATVNHFTHFGVLSCSPDIGEGAPDTPSNPVKSRIHAAWQLDYDCPAAKAYKLTTLNGNDYYAQEFTAGTQTGAIVDNPVLGQALFLPTNVWTAYEPKAGELGGPLSQQLSAPKHFIDSSHNFREQEIWNFEYGFVSKNTDAGATWEAHPYFPKFPQGQFAWKQDSASGKYRLELTTDFDPAPPADGITNPPPTPAATAQVRMVIEDELTGVITKTSTTSLSQGTGLTIPASGYDYYPTQTLKVFIEANRGDLIGYSRCNYYDPEDTNKRYYYLIPSVTPPAFGYDCVGNGVPDTTPPKIEILQVFATDNKELSPLGATILVKITDEFGIASQSATISAGSVVTPLIPFRVPQWGPDVYAATFEGVPERTLITFKVDATDNSGLSASVITQTWPADWQLLDLRTCGPSCSGRSHATAEGNPVLTFSGDKAETFPLLYVPGPGEADINLSITYNSANIRTGLFGAAMASSLESHLVLLYNPLVNGVEVVMGDGGRLRFEDNGNGTFTAASPGSDDTLVKQGSGYLFTTYDQKSYRFDENGRLIEQLDRNGNAITYGYSGDQLTSLTTGGRTVTLTYDGDYVKTLQIGAKVVTLTYKDDKLVDIENPEKGHWRLEYDSHKIGEIIDERGEDFAYTAYNHYLTKVTTPEGRVKNEQSYDTEGRVISQISSAEGELNFTYVENSDGSRETQIADAYDHIENHYYNALGQLEKKRDREGQEELYFYNADFHLERKVDFNGETWEYKRDDNGNITETFGPEGFHEEMKYNKFNFLTYRQDADNYEWIFEYDGQGNLIKITQPDTSFSRIVYDGRGLPTDVYDFNGNHSHNDYDPLTGDLLSAQDGEDFLNGQKTNFKYDEYGRLVKMIRPRANEWDYFYDLKDNLTAVNGPLTYHTEFKYDGDNLLTDEQDADTYGKHYQYDARGRLKEFRNGEDEPTFYRYKEMNELKEVENARGAITAYSYDNNYRVIQVDMAVGKPEQVTLKYTYDGLGNILFSTDGEGRVTAYDYNGLSRLEKMTQNYKAGASSNADTNVVTGYKYDGRGNLTKLTNPLLAEIEYGYDSAGRLAWQENEENERTEYGYDKNGNLTRITYPEKNYVETEYNGRNQPRLSRDGQGFATEFRYDPNGNLELVIAPDKVTRRLEYNPLEQAIKVTENYIPGSPINADDETNVMTEYGYSLAGDLTQITNPRSFVFTFSYDQAHRRTGEKNPAGEIVYTYDKAGNLTETLDANQHPWQTEYDYLNRPTASINPETDTVHLQYDRANNVIVLTDGRGHPTQTEYDALNRPKIVLDRMGFQTDYGYDATGNLRQLTDGNRHTTDFEYDRAHRLMVRIDAEKFRTEYEYDDNGRLILKRIPFPNPAQTIVERYDYDGRDLLKWVSNGEEEVTQYLYNNVGLQETKIDPDEVQTRYEYDSLRRLNQVIMNYDGSGVLIADRNVAYAYRYDRTGNLESILDANGNKTTFTYDGMNRLTHEEDANTNTWDYEYDPVGNRKVRIDALRQRTDYAYYDDNQLKRIDYQANQTFVEYSYDENNNRLSMTDHLGLTHWQYDKLDRVTDVTDPFNRHLGYAYDALNRTGLTYPDGRTVSYGYYLNDWLKTVTDPESNVTGYERDPAGRVTHITNPNSTVSDLTYDRANRLLTLRNYQVGGAGKLNSAFTYTYDDVGQRTRMVAEYGWRNPPLVTSDYTYDGLRRLIRDADSEGVWTEYSFDRVGNRLTLRTNDDAQSPRPFDEQRLTYSYNAINQLLTVVGDTHPGQPSTRREDNTAQALHAFRHEVAAQAGNHISQPAADTLLALADSLLADLYGSPAPKQDEVTTALAALRGQVSAARDSGAIDSDGIENSLLVKLDWGDKANNGVSGDLQTTTFSYDANGNRINKEFPGPQGPKIQGTDYTYDPENRLVTAQDYQGNVTGNRIDRAITTLAYDGDGRRLVKEYDPKTGGGGTKRTEYVFDGLDPVAEYSTQNNQYENFYRGDEGRIITMHHFPSGTAGQMFWFHYDGLGSVSGLTKQSGQSTHNYRYEAYGQIEMPPGNFTDPHNHYTFTGQEWDENLGQYEFFARKYDPMVGVWTTQDVYRGSVRQPGSLHRYGYVENTPPNFADIYGFSINCSMMSHPDCPQPQSTYKFTQNNISLKGLDLNSYLKYGNSLQCRESNSSRYNLTLNNPYNLTNQNSANQSNPFSGIGTSTDIFDFGVELTEAYYIQKITTKTGISYIRVKPGGILPPGSSSFVIGTSNTLTIISVLSVPAGQIYEDRNRTDIDNIQKTGRASLSLSAGAVIALAGIGGVLATTAVVATAPAWVPVAVGVGAAAGAASLWNNIKEPTFRFFGFD